MADDRIDWASVMAVHTMAIPIANCAGYEYTDGETPVPGVLSLLDSGDPEPVAIHLAIAAALREAHEAGRIEGRREKQRVIDRAFEEARTRWKTWELQAEMVATMLERETEDDGD